MKIFSYSKGFTLVELLVVVAIIAILSTIGLTLFNGAQQNARDARRRSDIDAIANALEANRPVGTIYYKAPTDGSWFSSGVIPTDTTTSKYCIKTYNADNGAVGAGETPTTWAATDTCPTVPAPATVPAGYGYLQAITGANYGFDNTAAKEFPDSTVKSWKICARLEGGTGLQVYCKNSAQ